MYNFEKMSLAELKEAIKDRARLKSSIDGVLELFLFNEDNSPIVKKDSIDINVRLQSDYTDDGKNGEKYVRTNTQLQEIRLDFRLVDGASIAVEVKQSLNIDRRVVTKALIFKNYSLMSRAKLNELVSKLHELVDIGENPHTKELEFTKKCLSQAKEELDMFQKEMSMVNPDTFPILSKIGKAHVDKLIMALDSCNRDMNVAQKKFDEYSSLKNN